MNTLFKTKLICLVIISFFYYGLNAQLFKKLNGPYGGGGKVYEGKNSVLFQLQRHNELYKSINGGATWSKMPATPALSYYQSLNVGYDGNLYCSNRTELYKSIDDGETWNRINYPGTYIQLVTSLADGTLLVYSNNQIMQSSDNGLNWQESRIRNVGQLFYDIQRDEAFAITYDSLFISKDKGIHWQFFSAADFGFYGNDFVVTSNGAVLVSASKYIWMFDSQGNLINKLDPNGSGNSKVDMALSSTTGRLFVCDGNQSYYSDNLGQSWIEINLPGQNNYSLYAFSFTPGGVLFGVSSGGNSLFRSTDNGSTWVYSVQGLNYAIISELDFITDSKILALTSDGLYYSEDRGETWIFLIESRFWLQETNSVVTFGDEFYFCDYNTIYYFENAKSPPIVVKTITDPFYRGMKLFVNPITGSLFYSDRVTIFGGVYKSIDKGHNWTKLQLNDIQSLHAFQNGSLICAGTEEIHRSFDDGENWDLVYSNGFGGFGYDTRILSSSYSDAHILYQVNPAIQLLSTSDFGTTWSDKMLDNKTSDNLHPFYGQALNNLEYFYVSGFLGQIFRSVDQGNTFNLYAELESLSGLAISADQKLYALTQGDGLYRSIESTSATNVLRGSVFKDNDSNCNPNNGDTDLGNQLIVADNGIKKEYGFSRKNGRFLIPIESGDYDINVEPDNNYWSSCTKTISASTYNFMDTLPLGLQVNSLCPFMKVDIQSALLRRCFESIIYLKYSNSGTLKAENSYIDVTLDPFFEFISSSIPHSIQSGNVYRFLLGDVDENTSGSFTIKIKISCNSELGQIHCAEAHIYPDSSCIQVSQAIIRTNSNCLGDSIDIIIKNDGDKAMTSMKKWTAIDQSISNNMIETIEAGNFSLNPGQEFNRRIPSRNNVLVMAEQDDSYPYNKISSTEINSCVRNPIPGSPPLHISSLDEEEPYIAKFCERNRGSFDPNDITGYPIGITNKKYIDKEQGLEYIIRFQNTGTDTAFNIRIENEIPLSELDLATLSLGASSHPYQFILSPEGKLIFSFSNIQLPDSNINEVASHGFVQYSIKPFDKLNNGTQILNDASIYFDFNAGVNTNVDFHTIGNPVIVKVKEVNEGEDVDFQIEPNPMHQSSVITINDFGRNQKYQLSCLDVHSKEMWTMDVTGNRANISKRDMSPGVYILVLKSNNGVPVTSKKVIVE